MTEIRLVKKYPHIKDEDVISIFQEGYIKGFENGRKGAIPIEWINNWLNTGRNAKYFIAMMEMVEQWEKENERP